MTWSASLYERVLALPGSCGLTASALTVLASLAWFADHGIKDPSHAWIGQRARLKERQVRNVLRLLEAENHPSDEAWIRRDIGQSAEGRFRRTRYEIISEKLNGAPPPWTEEVARAAAASGVRKVTACLNSSEVASANHSSNMLEIAGDPTVIGDDSTSEIADGASGRERARERTRPSLAILPEFNKFDWGSDEIRTRAAAVLAVCGPGLDDPSKNEARLFALYASLADGLDGPWSQYDFRLDVLPAIAGRLAKPRAPEKRLRLFYPLIENIMQYHNKRKDREAKRTARIHRSSSARDSVRNASNGFEQDSRKGSRSDELDRALERHRRSR